MPFRSMLPPQFRGVNQQNSPPVPPLLRRLLDNAIIEAARNQQAQSQGGQIQPLVQHPQPMRPLVQWPAPTAAAIGTLNAPPMVPSTLLNYGPGEQNAARTQYRPIPGAADQFLAHAAGPQPLVPDNAPLSWLINQVAQQGNAMPGQGAPIDPTEAIAQMVQQGAIPPGTTDYSGQNGFLSDPLGNLASSIMAAGQEATTAAPDVANAVTGAVGSVVGSYLQDPSSLSVPAGKAAIDYGTGVEKSGSAFVQDPSLTTGLGLVGSVANLPGINKPYEWHIGVLGGQIHAKANGQEDWDPLLYVDEPLEGWTTDKKNLPAINDAFDNGIDINGDGVIDGKDLKGGHAVYALYLQSNPDDSIVNQLVRAAQLDPLTMAALAASGLEGLAKSLAAKVARGVELSTSEKMLFYAAKAGYRATSVPNAVADAPFTALGKGFGKVTGSLFKPSAAAVTGEIGTTGAESLDALTAARRADTYAQTEPVSTTVDIGPLPTSAVDTPVTMQPQPNRPTMPITYVKLPDGGLREATPAEITLAGKGNSIELVTDPVASHWLSPEMGRKNPPGTRPPSLYEHVKQELAQTNPAAAAEFDRRYKSDPKTVQFINDMAAHDTSPLRDALAAQGNSGKQLDTVDKVLTGIQHAVEVQRPLYRDVTGNAPPDWRFDYHDPESAVILDTPTRGGGRTGTRYSGTPDFKHIAETAVFGTEDQAKRAREYLHVQAADSSLSPAARGRYQALLDETSRMRNLDSWSQEPGLPNLPDASATADLTPPEAPSGSPAYASEVERHVAEGRLSQQQGDILNQPVEFGNQSMSYAELFDKLAVESGSDRLGADQATGIMTGAQRGEPLPRGTKMALNAWDKVSQANKEAIQFNVVTGARGSIGDAIGDAYSMLITGHPGQALQSLAAPVAGLGEVIRSKITGNENGNIIRMLRATQGADPAILNDLPEFAPLNEMGMTLPHDFLPRQAGQRADVVTAGETTLHQGVMKVTGGRAKKFTGAVTGIFANKALRDFRTALDLTRRVSLFTDQALKLAYDARTAWEGHLDQIAAKAGIDPQQWLDEIHATAKARVEAEGKAWNGTFSPEDVLVATGSTDLSRRWRSTVESLKAQAKQEVDRILFSYKRTNADEALSRAVYFHYWQSRALVLHTRTAIKNPWLLATYYRTWQALKQKAEKSGYPKSVTGFLQFMGDSTNGWYGVFSPAAIVVPYTMFVDAGGRESQPFWQKIGLFLNPIVEGAAAAMGTTDNVPDITGSYSVRNMVRATLDWGNAHGIDFVPGGDAPAEDFVRNIESHVIALANSSLRKIGVTDKEFAPYDPKANQTVQLRSIVQQLAEKQFGPPADAQGNRRWDEKTQNLVDDAMARAETGTKGNSLSEEAFKQWSTAQIEGRVASMAIPGGARMVYAPLQQDRARSSAGFSALAAGQEPTPEQQAAMDVQARVNAASPEGLDLVSQQQQYGDLGSKQQREIANNWNLIAYGSAQELNAIAPGGYAIGIDGLPLSYAKLTKMTDKERIAVADAYISHHKYDAEYKTVRDAQTAFKDTHPAYQGYSDFRRMPKDLYNGDVKEFRTAMMRASTPYREYIGHLPQDTRSNPAKLDEASVSMKAYLSTKGITDSIYAPKLSQDTEGFAQMGIILKALGGNNAKTQAKVDLSTPEGKLANLTDKLTKNGEDMAAYNQAAMSVTNGVPFEQLPPQFQEVATNQMKQRGITKPSTPEVVAAYNLWKTYQPDGTDTSPEAYIKFLTDYEAKQKAA